MPVRKRFGSWGGLLKVLNKKPIKFIPSANGFTRKGVRNKSRERIVNNQGYIQIFEPNHPTANKIGYCLEHRYMAWNAGLLTDIKYIIHHKDGDKKNNSVENLECMKNSLHTTLHHKGKNRPRSNSVECIYEGCSNITSSKYGLCTKHYRLQWQRKRDGLIDDIEIIGNIHEGAGDEQV